MMNYLENAINVNTLTMVFAAIAAAATVLTLAMPIDIQMPQQASITRPVGSVHSRSM